MMLRLLQATALWRAGYSLIPVNADKTPVQAWKNYQYNRASYAQVLAWCESGHQLAIITGHISGVFVLDFDTPTHYEAFVLKHPNLAQTLTIKTRRGYHLYYRAKLQPATQKASDAKVDLLAEGCYAIAPGAVINGHTYKTMMEYPQQPRTLNFADTTKIEIFINNLRYTENAEDNETLPYQPESTITATYKIKRTDSDQLSSHCLNRPEDYLKWYQEHIANGRNNTLYRVARRMCSDGYSHQVISTTLTTAYVETPAPPGHPPQTAASRRKEAAATIASATRSRIPASSGLSTQIPNPVREALHRQGLTAIAQVLDALRMKGYRPGTVTYGAEIYRTLRSTGISRHIIEKASRWLLIECPDNQKKTASFGGKKRGNKHAAKFFKLPTDGKLCRLLDIDPDHASVRGSDYLSDDALKSPSKYRMAHLSQFIKRVPGQYTNRYLQHKLGVCERTIRTYKTKTGIKSIPQYAETPIRSYRDFQHIPDAPYFFPQFFLQDSTNKRYPALRVIAAALKRKGRRFSLMRQLASYLYHDNQPSAPQTSLKVAKKLHKTSVSSTSMAQSRPVQTADNVLSAVSSSEHSSPRSTGQPLTRINQKLSLVSGLGPRRVEKLHSAGIFTLEQLIMTSPEKLYAIPWAHREYLSLNTCMNWIIEARLLLGWQLTPAMQAHRKRHQTRQTIKRFKSFVKRVCQFEDNVFNTGDISELEWHQVLEYLETDGWSDFFVRETIEQACDFCDYYQERITGFLEKADDELIRYGLGDQKTWKSLQRRLQQCREQLNNVNNG